MRRLVPVLLVLASYPSGGQTTIPRPAEPVATLEVSRLLPAGPAENIAATTTFISDTAIAVGVCSGYTQRTCSLSVIRWNGNTLSVVATTGDFGLAHMNLHRSPGGSVLAMSVPGLAVLYSADLSSRRDVQPVSHISSSGQITAQWVRGGWMLHRVNQAEPIRSGKGSMRSVSDEFVVFQDGDTIRTETISGNTVGSFTVRPESQCATLAELLAGDRLFVEDCKEHRIVDFSGNAKVKLQKLKGWSANSSKIDRTSADARRMLFDFWSRKVSFWRNAGETAVAFATLGMGVGDEEDNREEIRVIDTTSGAKCFDLHRSFPMGAASFDNTAAISPSGQFVAIAADGKLSVYQLPAVCGIDR
jgi:hypothetical protein